MDDWQVNIETHTRDDLMKVCALLAKVLEAGDIHSAKRSVHISSKSAGNGKSAIVDGITAALSDKHSCYKLSASPLVERREADSLDNFLCREFMVNGRQTFIRMDHKDGRNRDTFVSATEERKSWVFIDVDRNLVRDFAGHERSGVDFVLNFDLESHPEQAGISILFEYPSNGYLANWQRAWDISVQDPGLQTDVAQDVLNRLRNFHDNRQRHMTPDNTLQYFLKRM